jgi:hypothetical protein
VFIDQKTPQAAGTSVLEFELSVLNNETQSSVIPNYTNGFSMFIYNELSIIRGDGGEGTHG